VARRGEGAYSPSATEAQRSQRGWIGGENGRRILSLALKEDEDMSDTVKIVEVPGWPRPKGYASGAIGQGRVLHVGGQIGTQPDGTFEEGGGLVEQLTQALANVVAVVAAAGGRPTDIASMTIYVTDVERYRRLEEPLGEAWRAHLGKHYPAIALLHVDRLYEVEALIEIQAVAYLAG
jgi:enamine deaminase RidA (YjgF/YER057c/UK114 family)